MRILKRVPGSVLWIMKGSATSRKNLIREAEIRGISADRLVFAESFDARYHLARLRLADIALDCLHHVGGATTLDALWAGVPVVVTAGDTVSNRGGRVYMEVLGMPELVGQSMRECERIAVELASDPVKRAATRAKLAERVQNSPLFDMKLFTRHFERALEKMWEIHEAGNPPQTFRVEPLDT